MRLRAIIPHITEKSLLTAAKGRYAFRVAGEMNKTTIREGVKMVYGVDAVRVTTINVAAKVRRVGKKMRNKVVEGWKKAVVELKAGQTIAAFNLPDEGVKKK